MTNSIATFGIATEEFCKALQKVMSAITTFMAEIAELISKAGKKHPRILYLSLHGTKRVRKKNMNRLLKLGKEEYNAKQA